MYDVKYVRTLSGSLISSNYDETRIWKYTNFSYASDLQRVLILHTVAKNARFSVDLWRLIGGKPKHGITYFTQCELLCSPVMDGWRL
jgi:hypothetical protein